MPSRQDSNTFFKVTDKEIIEGLIARDGKITRKFFYVKCRPLMYSIIGRVFAFEVDYDELINELYIHIMENDAARLRTFSYSSSVYQWIKTVAIRFFQHKRDRIIENQSKEPLYIEGDPVEPHIGVAISIDLKGMISRVDNPRYRLVLQKSLIEDMAPEVLAKQMGVTVANLYNIKKRAMNAFLKIAKQDDYGRKENDDH